MAIKLPIYMDYHATTPVDPRVVEAMLPYFTEHFGNAASRNHPFGWEAEEAVEKARKQVADLIGANAKEIVFTSGATESDNLAIKGVAEMYREKGNHIITAVTEHKAIIDTCKRLEKDGYRVTYLPVQKDGRISLDELKAAITDKTILITIMAANNEIGVIQPIAEIGAIAKEKGILFHTDAVQIVGKVPFNVNELKVDMASLSAHKMYGPKGVGALYVRRRNPRVLLGADHRRRRPRARHALRARSTFRASSASARPRSCASRRWRPKASGCANLRDYLNDKLHKQLDELYINGSMEHRLPHNLNISFAYVEGESLLMGINDVAVSSGSACTSASLEPSYVLKALGAGDDLAHSSIRFGLGRWTTKEEVDYVADKLTSVVSRAARHVAAVRAGQGRRRSVDDGVAETLKAGTEGLAFSFETGLLKRRHGLFEQSDRPLRKPAQRRVAAEGRPNVGTGLVGAPECGDVMKLQVKVNPATGVIDDAKFKTFGCGSAIASSSLATEWLKGKTVDEALAIKNTDIVTELSLPPVKIHCSVLAEDAIKAAICRLQEEADGDDRVGGNGSPADGVTTG